MLLTELQQQVAAINFSPFFPPPQVTSVHGALLLRTGNSHFHLNKKKSSAVNLVKKFTDIQAPRLEA